MLQEAVRRCSVWCEPARFESEGSRVKPVFSFTTQDTYSDVTLRTAVTTWLCRRLQQYVFEVDR